MKAAIICTEQYYSSVPVTYYVGVCPLTYRSILLEVLSTVITGWSGISVLSIPVQESDSPVIANQIGLIGLYLQQSTATLCGQG